MNKGLVEQLGSWDQVYKVLAPAELPWNAGKADSDLVRTIESGTVALGRVVDLGAGPGHDAIYLATKGFQVLAVDIAPAAIELAKTNARLANVESKIEFKVQDILQVKPTPASMTLIHDRGCFHTLQPQDRGRYVDIVRQALAPNGTLLLKTFSDKEPPGPGPYRFTRLELEQAFAPSFELTEFVDSIFEGPRKPKAYFCVLRPR